MVDMIMFIMFFLVFVVFMSSTYLRDRQANTDRNWLICGSEGVLIPKGASCLCNMLLGTSPHQFV